MNQKELTKTFMMISNWKKPFGLHGFYKNNSALIYGAGAVYISVFEPISDQFQTNSTKVVKMLRGRCLVNMIITFWKRILLRKYNYFSSFGTGNCTSNFSFKWMKNSRKQLGSIKVQVQLFNSLIWSLKTYHRTFYPLVTGPVHSCAISTPRGAYSPAAVSAHWTYRTHCHLCPSRYSFSPESSEAFDCEVSCPRTHHLNNVPRLRGEKHDISLKILHQAGFETARQAATSAKRYALAIVPCLSLTYGLRLLDSHTFWFQLYKCK